MAEYETLERGKNLIYDEMAHSLDKYFELRDTARESVVEYWLDKYTTLKWAYDVLIGIERQP